MMVLSVFLQEKEEPTLLLKCKHWSRTYHFVRQAWGWGYKDLVDLVSSEGVWRVHKAIKYSQQGPC